MTENFYSLTARSLQGKDMSMDTFRGKVILVVNTASKCGFTPQYEGLEMLFRKYSDRGFVILGFPCNQFAGQEPGSEEEIAEGCIVNYGVTFPMFSKISVNGKDAHPVFIFLKKRLPWFLSKRIKWNFTKFLIDAEGKPYKRYSPSFLPEKIAPDIEKLLEKAGR